jgi:cobalt-zinc-cadmium efflux system outer membrane protein
LLELAHAHNPVLDVRRAAIAEARLRASLADREAWPTLSVGAQYSREGAPGGGTPQDSILGTLSFPIPSFQLNQAERAASAARLEVALAERDALRSVLAARLEALRTGVNAAVARVSAYGEDILPRFAENMRLLRRAFELGEIDLLQLSVALERFLSVQIEALDAYVDYASAIAALEAEIGAELLGGAE